MPDNYSRSTLIRAALRQRCGDELNWSLSLARCLLITLAAILALILKREGDDATEWVTVAYLHDGIADTWYLGREYWADALLAPHTWWHLRYFVARVT